MGRPPKVEDDELIDAVDSDNRDGFLITTPEVADKVGVDRRTASSRLTDLEESGHVVSEPHGRTTGWHLPDEIVMKQSELDSMVTSGAGGSSTGDVDPDGNDDTNVQQEPETAEASEIQNGIKGRFSDLKERATIGGMFIPTWFTILVLLVAGKWAHTQLKNAAEKWAEDGLVLRDGRPVETAFATFLSVTVFCMSVAVISWFVYPRVATAFAANAVAGAFMVLGIPVATRIVAIASIAISTKSINFCKRYAGA